MSLPTVCHVLHSLQIGGAEMLAKQIAERMSTEYRAIFACLDFCGELGDQLRQAGYKVKVIGRNPGFDYSCAKRLNRFCGENDVRLIHAHQYAPFFYSSVGRFFAKKIPILFTEHGRDYPDFPRRKRILANRVLLQKRDGVVAVSECVRQALISNEGLPAACVEVIRNGVDLSAYDPMRPMQQAVRAELGLDDDHIVFMQVARLNRLKDHPTAIRAVAKVAKIDNRICLLFVGDGEDRAAIEQLVGELGLESHVRLLGARNDVPRLLQAADVFMLSSLSEGIPLTLIEAMASRLPCLATDVGGISEVIENSDCGVLVPASDSDALAEKILDLMTDDRRADAIGTNGHDRVHDCFGQELMLSEYASIYRRLMPRATAGSE